MRDSQPDARAPEDPAIERVAESLNADILFYNADIESPLDREFVSMVRARKRRANVLLILVTNGGDPDAAYRIARCLQANYERFCLFVTGYCKSAGTLIALGAHELIVGDQGELGPLDVQMSKRDSLLETQSGLTVNAALTALQSKAYLAFEEFFLETETRSQGAITVQTAGDIASKLTTGLFAPLYAQVDPVHVGEAARGMQIADNYGRRLIAESKSMNSGSLNHLVTHYPSHGFVIDREEIRTLFSEVREPTAEEQALAESLGEFAILPASRQDPILEFLSKEVAEKQLTEIEVEPRPEAASQAPLVVSVALAEISPTEENNGGTGPRARPSDARSLA